MKNAIIIFLAILLMVGTASATTVFSDDAETGVITDNWEFTDVGLAEYSSDVVHSGSYAIAQILGSDDVQMKNTSTAITNGYIEAWLYDTGNESVFSMWMLNREVAYLFLGVSGDFASTYSYNYGGEGYADTGVARTEGWHKFRISTDGTNVRYYIDDVLIDTKAIAVSFSNVEIGFHKFNTERSFADDILIEEAEPVCGDNVTEGDEVCDGTDLTPYTSDCDGYESYTSGTLACSETCDSFVTADCGICGNDVIDGTEFCDGTDVTDLIFSDYAETGVITDKWTKLYGNSMEYSSDLSYGGSSSIAQIFGEDTSPTVYNATIPTPIEAGYIEAWMYDNVSDADQRIKYMLLRNKDHYDGKVLELGVAQTDGGEDFINGNTDYMYKCGDIYQSTGITRTTGWHKFRITNIDGQPKFYIDDTYIDIECDIVVTFSSVQLSFGMNNTERAFADNIKAGSINTCVKEGMYGGELGCETDCSAITTDNCWVGICVNNIIDENETCDGTDLNGLNCSYFGYDLGSLSCMSNCSGYVTSGCSDIVPVTGFTCPEGSTICGVMSETATGMGILTIIAIKGTGILMIALTLVTMVALLGYPIYKLISR